MGGEMTIEVPESMTPKEVEDRINDGTALHDAVDSEIDDWDLEELEVNFDVDGDEFIRPDDKNHVDGAKGEWAGLLTAE